MKTTLIGLILFYSSCAVLAQDKPKVEIFGGYSFTRLQPQNVYNFESLHGGHASVTFNGGFMDFVVDFSAYKGNHGSIPLDLTAYNLMVGTRFGRRGKKISYYMHSLYGVSVINTELGPGASPARSIRGTMAFVPTGVTINANVNDRIAIRLFQADLLFIQRPYPLSSINPRFSTGIVIQLGKK